MRVCQRARAKRGAKQASAGGEEARSEPVARVARFKAELIFRQTAISLFDGLHYAFD
jgi:hypothetical protein